MDNRLINRAVAIAALLASGTAQAGTLHHIVDHALQLPEPGLLTLFGAAAALLFMTRRRKPSA